jgi:type II secretory pathway predicted ATPase ExeA
LLRKALHAFSSNVKTAYVSDALVAGNDLLRPILTDLALGDSHQSRSAMIKRLAEYLLEQFEQGDIVALMIDEAQKMSFEAIEELTCLGNLETEKAKLLQIVLAGQPELEQRLERQELRQLRQRIALRCRLKPIQHDEVQAYMDARLCIVGYRSEDIFEANAVEKIACFSNGIPRLINIICDNAILAAHSRSALKVTDAMIDMVAENLRVGQSGYNDRYQTSTYPLSQNTAPDARWREGNTVTKRHLQLIFGRLHATARWLHSRMHVFVPIILLSTLGIFVYSQNLRGFVSGVRSGFAREAKSEPASETVLTIDKPVSRDLNESEPEKVERFSQGNKRTAQANTKDLFVVEDSFVRAHPSPNAKIIATLTPGTRIQVTGPTGAYYGVRSRGTKTIRGYVHKEDAFFEAKSETW